MLRKRPWLFGISRSSEELFIFGAQPLQFGPHSAVSGNAAAGDRIAFFIQPSNGSLDRRPKLLAASRDRVPLLLGRALQPIA